jgi:branched-chain amino acid transport system substrate-binding protein
MNRYLIDRKTARYLIIWSLIAGFLIALTIYGLRNRTAGEIRIGVIAPLTGEPPGVGASTVRAAELAADQVNEAGGLEVRGQRYRLALLVEDSANIPDTAVAAARKLINQDHVAVIIGPQISRNAIPVATVAENAHIPMISPYSTNPATTSGKQYVFRIAYVDSFQGEVMARFALEQLNVQTAAVLYDVANEYNRDIAEFFRQSFTTGGGQVVAFESYTTGETDFRRQLAVILAGQPQVLFLPNFNNDIVLQVHQAQTLGITATLLGSDSWDWEQLVDLAAVEGAFFSTHYVNDAANATGQRFVELFRQQYNEAPDDEAALTYDAFNLLFQAIQNAGQVDPESIQRGLRQIEQFQGVTGLMRYTGTGDPEKSAIILQIKDGEAQYYETIEP